MESQPGKTFCSQHLDYSDRSRWLQRTVVQLLGTVCALLSCCWARLQRSWPSVLPRVSRTKLPPLATDVITFEPEIKLICVQCGCEDMNCAALTHCRHSSSKWETESIYAWRRFSVRTEFTVNIFWSEVIALWKARYFITLHTDYGWNTTGNIIPEPGPPPPLPEVLRTLFTQQKLDSVMSLILAFILLQGAYIHTYKTTVINVNLPSTSLVQKCV